METGAYARASCQRSSTRASSEAQECSTQDSLNCRGYTVGLWETAHIKLPSRQLTCEQLCPRMPSEKASAALFDQLQKAIESGEGDEVVGKLKVRPQDPLMCLEDMTIPDVTSRMQSQSGRLVCASDCRCYRCSTWSQHMPHAGAACFPAPTEEFG